MIYAGYSMMIFVGFVGADMMECVFIEQSGPWRTDMRYPGTPPLDAPAEDDTTSHGSHC